MNYRHHFHAGNFADVMKHALLTRLVLALQRKDKGLLYLDTHAGRGGYDLEVAATGDSLARKPEWPDGVGRLLGRSDLPPALTEYLALARKFDASRRSGVEVDATQPLRYYPGSPWFVRELARAQDRLALYEKQPEECVALRELFQFSPRTQVQEADGYGAVRALLPPPERRALVLIDPPFEAQDEFAQVVSALEAGLRRLPGGVFAVWYPLTERARLEGFFKKLRELKLPPTFVAELLIAGEESSLKMKGCGLLVLNPPWQFDREARPLLGYLGRILGQEAGGGGNLTWLVEDV